MPDRSEQISQQLLTKIETRKQEIQELSDEELVEVAGGIDFSGAVKGYKAATVNGGNILAKVKSAVYGLGKDNQSIWNYARDQAAANPKK